MSRLSINLYYLANDSKTLLQEMYVRISQDISKGLQKKAEYEKAIEKCGPSDWKILSYRNLLNDLEREIYEAEQKKKHIDEMWKAYNRLINRIGEGTVENTVLISAEELEGKR